MEGLGFKPRSIWCKSSSRYTDKAAHEEKSCDLLQIAHFLRGRIWIQTQIHVCLFPHGCLPVWLAAEDLVTQSVFTECFFLPCVMLVHNLFYPLSSQKHNYINAHKKMHERLIVIMLMTSYLRVRILISFPIIWHKVSLKKKEKRKKIKTSKKGNELTPLILFGSNTFPICSKRKLTSQTTLRKLSRKVPQIQEKICLPLFLWPPADHQVQRRSKVHTRRSSCEYTVAWICGERRNKERTPTSGEPASPPKRSACVLNTNLASRSDPHARGPLLNRSWLLRVKGRKSKWHLTFLGAPNPKRQIL